MLKYARVFLLVAVVFCQTANAEWADWVLNTTLEGGFEDNISFAVGKDERLSDLIVSPSIVFGRYYQLGDFTRLRIAADMKAKGYKRYDGLNSLSSGIDVSLAHKFGVGREIPWLRVHAFAGYLSVSESVRNSWIYNGGITVGKRLSERFDMLLSYNFIYRNGRESKSGAVEGFMNNPFDQAGSKGAVVLNYLLTERLLASIGDSVYYGGINSTNDPSNFDRFKSFTNALIWDNTFDRRLCTYKFNALVNEFTVGLSYALSGHASVNVNYVRVDGYASDLHYYDNLLYTSVKYSF
ncbi:MAG: hypothetical protein HQL05_14465 [Nitrospirae bacterium]|nr:hypothetical protein [Nitrospirota bacterium]